MIYIHLQKLGQITKLRSSGAFLPVIVMMSTLFIALVTSVIGMAMSNIKTANNHRDKVLAMEISEAGVNYYLWHLSHNNKDYCDSQTCIGDETSGYGPYTHDYKNISNQIIGTYELKIFPPSSDSTVVRIESTGSVKGRNYKKKIICELGMPSFSKYSLFVQGKELWLGSNEKISGTVFVNGSGICNQGEITKDSYSTELAYDSYACGDDVPGITGSQTAIFGGSINYPVTKIDFKNLQADMTELKNNAINNNGLHFDSSGSNGYHVVLNDDNFDLYRVTQYDGSFTVSNTSNSNDLSIKNQTLIDNYDYPEGGIMYFEDNIWVNGKINNQKITIVAADPETSNENKIKSIVIPDNLLFTNYDGTDKIGLLAQNYIYVPRKAPTNLEIDAAMIAYKNTIQIKGYCSKTGCPFPTDRKTKIKVFGSMSHNGGLWWTWDYGSGQWSGYQATETVIDESNVLQPPPHFPLTGSYTILSWHEE